MRICPWRSVSMRSGNLARSGSPKNLGPTGQIEPGLRSEIWKLDGDRHEEMIRQKLKYASTLRRSGGLRYEVAVGTIRFLLAFTSLLLPDLRINGTNRVKNTLLILWPISGLAGIVPIRKSTSETSRSVAVGAIKFPENGASCAPPDRISNLSFSLVQALEALGAGQDCRRKNTH